MIDANYIDNELYEGQSDLTASKLLDHRGHEIVIAEYGRDIIDRDLPVDISLECETCNLVLADFQIGEPAPEWA